ncbi:GIY-YIG nuclease family protein [bacterium]|nr:GIY-YIG nuclease family protein [bacterium]
MSKLIHQQPSKFDGFGTSILTKAARRSNQRDGVVGWQIPADRMQARAMLHDHCPLTPGVYGWLDRNDQVCYVGKSKTLRKRLLSYFAKTPSDPKMGRIVRHSRRIVWEPVSHELLALIREQELINRWRPDFNKQGQPTRRQPAFICVGGGAAPRAFVARQLTNRSQWSIGPIAGTGRLKAAVEAINLTFGLRDCPDRTKFHFNNQRQLFDNVSSAGCIRYELGSCPAPCAAFCSKEDYQSNVNTVIDFLSLRNATVLNKLEQEMIAAGARQHFEKATLLRDRWKLLCWLTLRLTALKEAKEKINGVVPVSGFNNQKIWLVLRGGRLVGSARQPRTPLRAAQGKKKLIKIAAQIDAPPANVMEMNLQLMIAAWYRKDADFRKSLMSFDESFDFCEQKVQGSTVAA